MHIEGLKNQQIKNSEYYNNSLAFGSKHVTRTPGRQVTDKAIKADEFLKTLKESN